MNRYDQQKIYFNASNNEKKKYLVKAILDNKIYAKKTESGYKLGLYYLILSKCYLKKNIWKLASAV